MSELMQDVRFALRMLRRGWGVTLVAIMSLAVAIGGNTAVFGLIKQAVHNCVGVLSLFPCLNSAADQQVQEQRFCCEYETEVDSIYICTVDDGGNTAHPENPCQEVNREQGARVHEQTVDDDREQHSHTEFVGQSRNRDRDDLMAEEDEGGEQTQQATVRSCKFTERERQTDRQQQ